MISYSEGPQNLNLNWCKNYKLQNTLISCEKVDFPYISMESAVFTKNNIQYKAVVFCSAKSKSYVSEAKLYPITLLNSNQVYKTPFIFYGSYPEVYANVQTAIPFDRAFLDMYKPMSWKQILFSQDCTCQSCKFQLDAASVKVIGYPPGI